MLDKLPELIDPLHFVERQSELSGCIQIHKLNRLADLLANDAGVIDIKLSFKKASGFPVLQGQITGMLYLICQKCLETIAWPVDRQFKLGMVASLDEADRLPGDLEPLMIGENKIPINDIIEEELILYLPAIPKHEPGGCKAIPNADKSDPAQADVKANLNNPFSVLATLKNSGEH